MFAMTLADRWRIPVRELLARLDSRELTQWMAFEKVRPPSREEEETAKLCHWLGRLWMDRPHPFSYFLPDRHIDKSEPMSPADMRSRLRGG